MINKKAILIIVAFIVTGFLVFSFANPSEENEVNENENDTTTENKVSNSSDDKKKENDKKGSQTSNKDDDKKTDDTKTDDKKYDSLDQNNNLGNTGNDYTGTQTNNTLAGGNTGWNQTGGNTGWNQTGGNTGGTQTSGNNSGSQTGGSNSGSQTGGNNSGSQTGGNETNTPEVNVDTLTGPSVFVSNDKEIEVIVEENNVINYTGVVEKANVDDFGVYYVNVVARAPYKYSDEILKNATVVTPYGEKYDSGFLQYDSDGYAYFSIPQGFINGVSSELSLTVNWGIGENIVYTLKSSINVVD